MIALIVGVITVIAAILGLWQIPIYRHLRANEKAIRAKEDEIDAVEPDINRRTSGTFTVEKQRLAQVKKAKVPLQRELERLKQERQFLLDRSLFFKH